MTIAENDGNAAFGKLHEAISELTVYLNDEGEADGEEDPAAGVAEVVRLAQKISARARAIKPADFEEEYPEDEDADAIDAEVVNYG